jgi:2,3-bisphosphoglycerate-dependent phosphoglycerate mutase
MDLHERGGIYLEDEQSGQRVGQPGKNRAYFENVYPELVLPDSLGSDGWWNRPFEEPEQRSARARRFLRELLGRHGQTEDHVAVVSHGGFFNDLMAALLLLPTEAAFWFILNNAAIARIDFSPEGTALVYLNRVDFLPGELIT